MVIADGRPEGAAQDRPMRIKIAGLGRGIEDRTGVSVEGLFEQLDLLFGFFMLKENAGAGIAGEKGREVLAGGGDTAVQATGFRRVFGLCLKQTFTEPFSIERGNLKDAMAAGRAARMAEEVWAGTLSGGGESRIDDLNKRVRKRNHGKPKITSKSWRCAPKITELSV